MSASAGYRQTEHFEFALKDKVKLKAINRPALVEMISVDRLGHQFRVAYWNDGVRKTEWVNADEIELVEEGGKA